MLKIMLAVPNYILLILAIDTGTYKLHVPCTCKYILIIHTVYYNPINNTKQIIMKRCFVHDHVILSLMLQCHGISDES